MRNGNRSAHLCAHKRFNCSDFRFILIQQGEFKISIGKFLFSTPQHWYFTFVLWDPSFFISIINGAGTFYCGGGSKNERKIIIILRVEEPRSNSASHFYAEIDNFEILGFQ